MKHNERMLFEKNNLGYVLVLSFIIINTLYSILTLNQMKVDASLGLFIAITIPLLLMGFLMAVKVQNYSKKWSKMAVGTGVFQILRVFIHPSMESFGFKIILLILLVSSGLICLYGGRISLRRAIIREQITNN